MSVVAAHINDAGITVLDSKRVLYREPGFALLEDDGLTTGNEAYAVARIKPRRIQHHYWADLVTTPLADRRFRHLSAADLVSRQLEQMWGPLAATYKSLVIAVPPYMSTDHLGLLLGIASEIKLPVIAMVDSAVAATRREYRNAVPVHIDISLHSTSLTRLAQPGRTQVERFEILDAGGIYELYDAWIRMIAEAFVKQSRFDPLHTAQAEQMLLDRLGGWLARACSSDSVSLELAFGNLSHEAEIESLELIGAAAPIYQGIASKLRALYRAEDTPAIQLSARIAHLPGLADMLKARVGGKVFLLEPGATARGALARCRDMAGSGKGISLIRQLPWDQAAVEVESEQPGHAHSARPTHLLFDHMAYRIEESPLVLGSQIAEGERTVPLPTAMPGVSRRHCSVRCENGQCVLEDYSRYGTFLNGHRIDGSAVLQVGDSLRLGSPGHELELIALAESHGT
ncbi:MAG: FHA domain-containing protein [Woeseia sp.]